MFGFEDGYAMFDMTPVENRFILEYLPGAKGDYVRVYLYGLLRCYHPEEGMTTERMARELNLEEEEVLQAYRYWERRGLVRRISDNPPEYRYINPRHIGGTAQAADPEYEAFSDDLYRAFGQERRLHGAEIQTCYEWVEELKLPPEAVVMLLRHMVRVKGKNFTIRSAEKLAVQMAQEGVRTLEDAEAFLSRDEEVYQGTKRVLKLLGKRNAPSEGQLEMYRKWTREWGFTAQAIEDACAETAKGDPNMGYLQGILERLRDKENGGSSVISPSGVSGVSGAGSRSGGSDKRSGNDGSIGNGGSNGSIGVDTVRKSREEAEELREVLRLLGSGTVNQPNLEWHSRLKERYAPEMIRLAARECGRNSGKPGDVEKMLDSWRQKGIENPEEAERYIAEFRAQSELLMELRKKWGLNRNPGENARAMVAAWEKELGFDREMILAAADFAAEAERPMTYLDKVLREYARKGVRTPEEARREHEEHRVLGQVSGKNTDAKYKEPEALPAQRYTQRDYSEPGESPEEMIARLRRGMGGGE